MNPIDRMCPTCAAKPTEDCVSTDGGVHKARYPEGEAPKPATLKEAGEGILKAAMPAKKKAVKKTAKKK